LPIGPKGRVGNVQRMMRVHRGDDAVDGSGILMDELGDSFGVLVGVGDCEGAAWVEVFLAVD